MKKSTLKKNQQGLTLIEIMIAMVLGLFVVAGAIKIFSSTSQTNRMLDNLSRIQENGRFAMALISRDIRDAGFVLCYKHYAALKPTAISGTNNDGLNNSDSITSNVSNVVCTNPPAAQPPMVSTPTIYSIGGTTAEPSLYKKVGAGPDQELIEGIEKMQILYGEDTDNDQTPNYYVSLDSVVDIENVISVRIHLLVRSLDNHLSTAPIDYQFSGTTHTPSTGDHRIRREFSSTIALRNRLP